MPFIGVLGVAEYGDNMLSLLIGGENQKCNVAGFPGVQASDGVCIRLSGYVSSQFVGQLK